MKKTTNYQLNQWEKTDRIMMDDFNADNAKIEAALAARSCQFYTASYVGTGETSRTVTFPRKLMAVAIVHSDHSHVLTWFRGSPYAFSKNGGSVFPLRASFPQPDRSLSWEYGNVGYALNEKGVTYNIFALLDADN